VEHRHGCGVSAADYADDERAFVMQMQIVKCKTSAVDLSAFPALIFAMSPFMLPDFFARLGLRLEGGSIGQRSGCCHRSRASRLDGHRLA
jgi:hypothetical protein